MKHGTQGVLKAARPTLLTLDPLGPTLEHLHSKEARPQKLRPQRCWRVMAPPQRLTPWVVKKAKGRQRGKGRERRKGKKR